MIENINRSKSFDGSSQVMKSDVSHPASSILRPPTSLMNMRGEKSSLSRPSTAVRAVGYASNGTSANHRFQQVFIEKARQKVLLSNPVPIDSAKDVNPQIKYRNLEMKILKLLESSIMLAADSNHFNLHKNLTNSLNLKSDVKSNIVEALSKAKEAFSLDRTLHRFRDQQGENVFHNFDLTYSVFFNLAEQYEKNEMYIEALNIYSIMTRNKMFPQVNQLKLNMGNIYYKMGAFQKAIKMYRMALDSVPNNLKQLRLRITHNIGILFVKTGQYADAAASFEFIMSERPDIVSGTHLILCYYALGDNEKIKNTFQSLVDVQPIERNEIENENNIIKLHQNGLNVEPHHDTDDHNDVLANQRYTNLERQNEKLLKTSRHFDYIFRIIKNDELATYASKCRSRDKRYLTMIVDLISPLIEENYHDGYNWCIEVIRSSNLSWLCNELELNKALVYLKQNDIKQAIETLQIYDRKKDSSMTANALINLSFIYINLGNWKLASQCVNQLNVLGVLKTNPFALNNASIVDLQNMNLEACKGKLERALKINPDCFQANYNLGLLAVNENNIDLAEKQFAFLKNHLMDPHSVQHSHVLYQLTRIQETKCTLSIAGGSFRIKSNAGSLQSYLQVLGVMASEIDSQLFEKVGSIYEQLQDHQQANQYFNEAYRINPSDIRIGSSIGSYYVKLQAIEKALFFYERAVLADPNDPNLMLRIASCFRNSYLPPKQYLAMFEKIYYQFPDNPICLRALLQVSKYLGLPELYEKYNIEYNRLNKQIEERQNEQRYQDIRISSSRAAGRLRGDRHVGNSEPSSISSTNLDSFNANLNGSSILDSNQIILQHEDPLGPPQERPRTGIKKILVHNNSSDEDDINTESLLPL